MIRSLGPTALATLMLVSSCKKDEPAVTTEPPPDPLRQGAIDRCAGGIERAMTRTTYDDAMGTYYRECSDVYSKRECRDAWREGADKPTEAVPAIADACRKAYCPELASTPLEMCAPDFNLSGPRFDPAWAQLFGVILEREGGESLTPPLLRLLVRLGALKAAPVNSAAPTASASAAAGASAAPAASTGAAPQSSASGTARSKPPAAAPSAR